MMQRPGQGTRPSKPVGRVPSRGATADAVFSEAPPQTNAAARHSSGWALALVTARLAGTGRRCAALFLTHLLQISNRE